jgi:arabinogalactan oligomer/maltooligosaccharide transport system substrate-binding protein
LVADLSGPIGAEVVVMGKSTDALVTDIRADVLGGLPPPDLVWGTQDELGFLQRSGFLQPAEDQLDTQGFVPATISGATLEGQRWGTPLAVQGYLLLLYNRGLVAQPPRTTDELISQARALTGGDRYGLVSAWAEPRWFLAWLAGFGGAPLAADGTPVLDTPQMIAALDLLKELRTSGPPPPSTYTEGARLFRQGRAAFAIDGDWSLEGYRAYSETLDLGVAAMPVVPATGRIAASPLSGSYLMYGRSLDGVRREQALALGAALARPPAQARIAGELGLLPALRAALRDPAVGRDAALAAAATQVEQASGLPATQGLHCVWDAIRGQLPPVILGQQVQADAAKNMQAFAEACMR